MEENNHCWVWEYEWRPCKEFLNDPDGSAFFENYAYSPTNEHGPEYDDTYPESNFIEFTIDGNVVVTSGGGGEERCRNWEYLDPKTTYGKLPHSCLKANLHIISRHADEDDEAPYDSYILCREEDCDKVRDLLVDSIRTQRQRECEKDYQYNSVYCSYFVFCGVYCVLNNRQPIKYCTDHHPP